MIYGTVQTVYCAYQRSESRQLHRVRFDRRGRLPYLQPCHHSAAEILHRHPALKPPVYHADVHRRANMGRCQRSHNGTHRGYREAEKVRTLPPMDTVLCISSGTVRRADVRQTARNGRAGEYGLHMRLRDCDLRSLWNGLHNAAHPIRFACLRGHDRRPRTQQAIGLPILRRGNRLYSCARHSQLCLCQAA